MFVCRHESYTFVCSEILKELGYDSHIKHIEEKQFGL